MLRFEEHPFNGTTYQAVGDGKVRVTKPETGTYGLFTFEGKWLEGDITQADTNMLRFVGGPDISHDHDVFWAMAPNAYHDGTIPVRPYPGTHMDDFPRAPGRYQPDKGMMTSEGMRSSGYQDMDFLLKNDRRPDLIPKSFYLKSPLTGGPQRVGTARFHKKEYHDLEVERLWKKTWQMVCREDDIPNVGDYHVYEVATLSYLIVRAAENEIRAFQNVCLHRGRILKDCSGVRAKEFRCPYHAWAWNLDGTLKEIPSEWDFPGVRETVRQLPRVQAATWAGFVFINPDPAAASLEEFLGPTMMDHYRKYNLQNRYKQAHVQKIVPSNWKVVMEGFMEGHHLSATHPQFVAISGDLANQRFDVFGNWGRCDHLRTFGSPQRGIYFTPEEILGFYRAAADAERERSRAMIGDEVDQYSDAELNDGGFHHLFPNINPWSGWTRITFRYRPHGDNPDESIMDVMLLAPWPAGKPKPPPAKLRKLGVNDSWTQAPELLSLSKILDQDIGNMPSVQAGLKIKQPPYIWYSAYQESIIRNFHRNYDKALGLTEYKDE
jgi:phenylpropionate dioxygenase-like ring-hydroxylating dioxygenase large terminal subunit